MSIIIKAQDNTIELTDSLKWNKLLNEVSVTGHRQIIRMKGNKLVTQVANTELSNLGSANDVLLRLPFINMNGNEISIVG